MIQVKAPLIDFRKDSTIDTNGYGLSQPSSLPVPLVVVEKVTDQEQADVEVAELRSLPVDVAKRAADSEPDFEVFRANTPEHHVEPGAKEDQAAPPFQHELSQSESLLTDTIDEESVQSSTDQTSSSDIINTPPEADELSEDDELNHSPLLSHETGLAMGTSELDRAPMFSYEVDVDEDDGDELSNGPLLPHETGFHNDSAIHSDDEHELSKSPLLSHEIGFSQSGFLQSGFSQSKGSNIATDYSDDDMASPHCRRYFKGRAFEPDRAPTFSHEARDDDSYDEDGTPLLSHERRMSAISISGSERSVDDGLFLFDKQPTFRHETTSARELFGKGGRASLFKTGKSNSTLPHKMPESDEDDDALRDIALESFPTNREQILERVATIGHHLPEDQVGEQHSPPLSVMSQACSSVDLRPIRSYASMPSVQEESDDDDEDMTSLGSPVMMSDVRMRDSESYPGFAKDPYATPVPGEHKRLELVEEFKNRVPNAHTAESSDGDSVGKHDGAKDFPSPLAKLVDSVTTPAKALNSLAAPLVSNEKSVSTGKENTVPNTSESEVGQGGEAKEDPAKVMPTRTDLSEDTEDGTKDKTTRAVTPGIPQQQLDQASENLLQKLFRTVFGSVGRFLTACFGDRKRTR